MIRDWSIVGVGSGWGAKDSGTADGPTMLMSNCPTQFRKFPAYLSYWHKEPPAKNMNSILKISDIFSQAHVNFLQMLPWLIKETHQAILNDKMPLIFGGDHSIAIGTWSGVKAAYHKEDICLVWIDAHMDAHTPQTSHSQNLHGMPLAALLGSWNFNTIGLETTCPILKPENVCLIGIRSYEIEEAVLLKKLGVRIYYIEEVKRRGFKAVFNEALQSFYAHKFGLSIDVDGFDPNEAPGTGTPASGGLELKEVAESLFGLIKNPSLLGVEIVEFNPHRDLNGKTCQLIWDLIKAINGII